jgi:hypothetical protein
MGLDVFAGRKSYGFNRAGRDTFEAWCVAQGLPEPFPGYHGKPAGAPVEVRGAQRWMTAFAATFPERLVQANGRSWEELRNATRTVGPADEEHGHSEAEIRQEWCLRTATAWYAFLKAALEGRRPPYYC